MPELQRQSSHESAPLQLPGGARPLTPLRSRIRTQTDQSPGTAATPSRRPHVDAPIARRQCHRPPWPGPSPTSGPAPHQAPSARAHAPQAAPTADAPSLARRPRARPPAVPIDTALAAASQTAAPRCAGLAHAPNTRWSCPLRRRRRRLAANGQQVPHSRTAAALTAANTVRQEPLAVTETSASQTSAPVRRDAANAAVARWRRPNSVSALPLAVQAQQVVSQIAHQPT